MARMQREWQTADAFYKNQRVDGRFGGEIDYGCFWSTDSEHRLGRLTWIPESGEFYIYALLNAGPIGEYMLLGRCESHNVAMAELLLSGWATACNDRKGINWIVKALGVHAQTYATDELAARAYARNRGDLRGTDGGWIYRDDLSKPICQGWGTLANMLIQRGHIRTRGEGYYIVDSRSMNARSMARARREVL